MSELKEFLDSKADLYNTLDFIEDDPISIPHKFSKKQDIEISGLLTATISWGQRKTIINNANKMMDLMDRSPYDFVLNHKEEDLIPLQNFVHRTFNGFDLIQYIRSLNEIYKDQNSLESLFQINKSESNLTSGIENFREKMLSHLHEKRFEKHIASPQKGSASKRLVMFLRWMVRNDNKGVDFGIWKDISPSTLSCPLDVHSGNVARKLGLLTRKQNDWKAVEELDKSLRAYDSNDPVKYDYALFGLGVFEGF